MADVLRIDIVGDNKSILKAFEETRKSAFQLQLEIEKYESLAFNEKSTAKLATYNRKLQELQAELKRTQNIGKEGFDAIGNAIEKTNNPLTKAFSGLRQIAYIIPGIGIAGIFNLAFEAIEKGVQELGLFSVAEDKAAKSAAELNKEISKQRDGAEQEVSHLKSLISVAQDSSLSTQKRSIAVKELTEKFPDYFKGLTTESALTKDLTGVTDLLTTAIYKRAEARAREADIAKKATEVFQNQQKIDDLTQKIEERKNVPKADKTGFFDFKADLENEQSVGILNDMLSQRSKLLDENSRLQVQIAASQHIVNNLTAETIQLDDKETKTKKEKNDEIKKEIQYYKDLFESYNKMAAAARTAEPVPQEDAETRKKRLRKGGDLNFDAPQHLTPAGKNGSGIFDEDIDDLATKRTQQLQQYNDQLARANQLANYGADAFANLFSSLARGEDIGQTLGNAFKELAIEIGKALVKALILKVVMSAFNIATGGVVGTIAGEALGAAIGGGGGSRGYSGGGFSTGPESGHYELLHGNEWVMRPGQVNSLIAAARTGGMAMSGSNPRLQVEVTGRVSANQFLLMGTNSEFSMSKRRGE